MKGSFSSYLLVIVAGLALLSVGGCGGGDPALTKAQFTRQANAICKQAAAGQIEAAGHFKRSEIVPGQYGPVTEVFVPPMERELRRLKALSPPQGDEEEVQAILEATAHGVKDVKADYLDLFVKEQDPFLKAARLLRAYGLDACAESPHAVIKHVR